MIITEPKGMLEAWFQAKAGIKHRIEDASYMGEFTADHKIRCVLVFHTWRGRDIEIDVPPVRLPLSLLSAAKRYVVDQLQCDRVTLRFRADNKESRRDAVRLGGQLEGRIRRFYPDGCDQLIYGILKEEYCYGR